MPAYALDIATGRQRDTASKTEPEKALNAVGATRAGTSLRILGDDNGIFSSASHN